MAPFMAPIDVPITKHLAAANADVARDVAAEHRALARSILAELIECAAVLDVQRPHPDDDQPFSPNNPPLCIRTATLTAALLVELRALNLYRGAPFQNWHGASSIIDLEKAMRNVACIGWPSLAGPLRPATSKTIAFGVRSTVDFHSLTSGVEQGSACRFCPARAGKQHGAIKCGLAMQS
jgi:hypothetical protein